ncbi:MAG: SbcC/MukB-like Walker B domain-containing protein [Lachnospiraceae bacterium]|nr:SbcC/MukB-like Walker B domain-containing protein [Lachnospiraceae bacterium]MDU3180600.1 SbcC/MukB-like Walker B domain-containing protein [Lachnospiraceae bacterium]
MRQSKKIFTKMLLNNWGGISHKELIFHEYVNLFSGKSGSGKSTVMDAIQVILYGSVGSSFLNKAADDAKNRRSVLSYLRGEQKDGTANREGMDFCSQIVLEVEDTTTHIVNCIGVAFEVGKKDLELKRYSFFSHSGRIAEDGYIAEDGSPYTLSRLRKFIEGRKESEDNRGRGEINRFYQSKEVYLNTIYDVILGYIEPGRFTTMEKSAIALRMTDGTGQFIRDYMFPKSKEGTVSVISEQLGAYREIKERVKDLENRIQMLEPIREHNLKLIRYKSDAVRTQAILKIITIESLKIQLQSKKETLETVMKEVKKIEENYTELSEQENRYRNESIEVETQIRASDYGQKEKELEEVRHTIEILSGTSVQWRKLLQDLKKWEENEDISAYISNPTLHTIEEVADGNINEEIHEKLKKHLKNTLDSIDEELQDLQENIRRTGKILTEKREIIEDLKNDRKPYKKELKKARARLQSALSDRYGRTIHVEIFADLFDITDEKWKNAIEGRLGRIKYSLVTAPEYALDAAKIFRKMRGKEFEEFNLINTAAIKRDEPKVRENTLYEAVKASEPYVDLCLKQYLGRIVKCETIEELHEVREGVTPDCYSYSNYIFRHLKEKDYGDYACIGTKVSKAKLIELEDEVSQLEKQFTADKQMQISLKEAGTFERLNNYSTEQLVQMSKAPEDLANYYKKEEKLLKELQELNEGTLIPQLKEKKKQLEEKIEALQVEKKKKKLEHSYRMKMQGNAETELKNTAENLEQALEGYVANEVLEQEVLRELETKNGIAYRKEKQRELEKLGELIQTETEERAAARNKFNNVYSSYGFTGLEHENDVYDKVLEQCQKDFEPKYKAEFEQQYQLVYHTLRENVIATIHGEIKAAFRHKCEINRMLGKIRFSDSIYQIDILPAENENRQFYEMLMAPELDSKVLDNGGYEGQLSLGEDEFYQKYETQILRLTEKFMPPRDEDSGKRANYKEEMEHYADYRNYLTFSMYEQVEDEDGNIRKNAVDDMAGRDSGGEGQNPKYVALFAGFAMLYMNQSNRDSKIRLVLLDEAFSKMDKERSEVCLHYARELELQLIVCVPDERLQSLIRNVDSVYGFRRHQNQISMMYIDKGDYLKMIEGEDNEKNIDA